MLYGTPPDLLVEVRGGILALIHQKPRVRREKYEDILNDLGSTGMEILIRVLFDVHDGHTALMARDGLNTETRR